MAGRSRARRRPARRIFSRGVELIYEKERLFRKADLRLRQAGGIPPLRKPRLYDEELTRYIFIWQIWLGVSIAQRDKQHIKVELLKSLVKNEKVISVVDIFATLVLIAFNVFLVINGSELVNQMYTRGNVSGAMRLPMWIVYSVLPISSFILSLRLIGQVVEDIKKAAGKEVE